MAAGLSGGGGREGERGKESPLHTLAARTFYHFISQATQIDMSRASDFKLLDRRAVDVLVAMREKNASSGPCPPGSGLTPPRWSSRSSPGRRESPSGLCAPSPGTP